LPEEQESEKPGQHDFWFRNPNDFSVRLGLNQKNCTCSKVEAGIAPSEGPVDDNNPPQPTDGVKWQEMLSDSSPGGPKSLLVPPQAGGWVRLNWKVKEQGAKRLSADFWTQPAGHVPPPRLEAAVTFVVPIQVIPANRELSAGTFEPGEKPREITFLCWSSTRKSFTLVPETPEVQRNRHPFVTCGQPVPLSPEQSRKIQQEQRSRVLCGYAVPITVREHLDNGQPSDIGPFRTEVELSSDVLEDEKLTLIVTGAVRADVTVVSGGEVQDRIELGNFPASLGKTRKVIIEADPDVRFQVVKVPDFLKVTLEADPQSSPTRKSWFLTVDVLPGQVNGPFPRADDIRLRDTVIILETSGHPPRRIRIPVRGMAGQR
jgi:hypothetical protein